MKQLSDTRESGKAYRPVFRGIAIAAINHFLDRSQSGRFIDSAIVVLVGGNPDSRQVWNGELRDSEIAPTVSQLVRNAILINNCIFDTRSFKNKGRGHIKSQVCLVDNPDK